MKIKLVSVIIPIYNVEQFLKQCVTSVINQTYDNLEIILVDDGSPDNCGKICDNFAQKDDRIKVIHKVNGGLSDARNAGIDVATGDYITFIDSDDFILPNMIDCLMKIIIKENIDMVQCDFIRSKSNFVDEVYQNQNSYKYKIFRKNKMDAYLKERKIDTMACGKIYKRSLFGQIRYPLGKLHEDVYTTYKLIHEAGSVAVTDYVGYVYRIAENSITTSKFFPKKLDSVFGEIERAEFIKKNYPGLCKQAYSGIIYACNQCLLQMAKSKFKDDKVEFYLQDLYRKYGKYYLSDKVSFLGKIVVALAMINENLAKNVLLFKR